MQLLDRDTRRTYRMYDYTQAHRPVPSQAYGMPDRVSSADKLYPVIESVKPDAKHYRSSNTPVPVHGAESVTP